MDRTEKIIKVRELQQLIEKKETQIAEENKELEVLEQRLKEESTSEIPVLLFLINETLPMPDDYNDYEFEYVYYFPDLDDIKCIKKHSKEEYLPNVVDMREFFKGIEMPSRIWPGSVSKYSDKLNYAVSLLKTMIDDLFVSNNINSWGDLASLLNSLPSYYAVPMYNKDEEKDQLKVRKLTKKDNAQN